MTCNSTLHRHILTKIKEDLRVELNQLYLEAYRRITKEPLSPLSEPTKYLVHETLLSDGTTAITAVDTETGYSVQLKKVGEELILGVTKNIALEHQGSARFHTR